MLMSVYVVYVFLFLGAFIVSGAKKTRLPFFSIQRPVSQGGLTVFQYDTRLRKVYAKYFNTALTCRLFDSMNGGGIVAKVLHFYL